MSSPGRYRPLPRRFFQRPADRVARELLGRYLVRDLPDRRLVLQVVETEAYLGAGDRASHAWKGRRTERNASLYLPPGFSYVYLIYGLHYCLNVVANEGEGGGAVLFRAGLVVEGGETMEEHRDLGRPPRPGDVAGGPGKLCQALSVDRRHDGRPLGRGELRLTRGEPVEESAIAVGPRVGIDYAGEAVSWPLRFAVRDCREVSRPRLS